MYRLVPTAMHGVSRRQCLIASHVRNWCLSLSALLAKLEDGLEGAPTLGSLQPAGEQVNRLLGCSNGLQC